MSALNGIGRKRRGYPRCVPVRRPTRNAFGYSLRLRSCLIDGEAVCCDEEGVPVFHKLRQRRDDRHVFLYAFDLIELDGKDLRREPI